MLCSHVLNEPALSVLCRDAAEEHFPEVLLMDQDGLRSHEELHAKHRSDHNAVMTALI